MKRWHCHTVTLKNPIIPVSSAGGLIYFYDDIYRDTYVCNPLTQSLKKLPDGSLNGRLFRSGMIANESGSYKVLRLSPSGEYEIYDSTTKCWSPRGTLPAYIKLPRFIFTDNVSIDNTIYYKHEAPIGIVSCDTSTGVWTQHLISLPLRSYDLKLAECDEGIMSVGMLSH
ncbi:F-box only protein [Trifolium repens]|nr:F-box only protein [Trifolium repens]